MPGYVFTQNTDFDGLFLENRNFPENVTNRKVVDNDENYLNMKFQPKILTRSRENAKKPPKTSFFDIKLLIKKN